MREQVLKEWNNLKAKVNSFVNCSIKYTNELEEWKRTSCFLLFEAKEAIQKGMLNLIPVNEADNPQRAREVFEFMKATKNQISRVID